MAQPIGELLRAAGAITQGQLDTALEQQHISGGRLASVLLNLGAADERTLATILSHQLGVPFVVLSQSAIAELERAIELDPGYEKLLTLARLYEKTGFSNKAFESWERCLRCCTDDKEADNIRSHMDKLLK
jgi:tetratricopeptide (TPR) repeat protein